MTTTISENHTRHMGRETITTADEGVATMHDKPLDRVKITAGIAEEVDELVAPYTETVELEHWDRNRNRKTASVTINHPSLLEQLRTAVTPGGGNADKSGGRAAPGSRPAARLDAIDALQLIHAGVTWWLRQPAQPAKRRGTLEGNLRALVGIATGLGDEQLRDLDADINRWWVTARTLADWEDAPFAPAGIPCPVCTVRNSLRIRLDHQVGVCTSCQSTWDAATIGILGRYVGEQLDAAAPTPPPVADVRSFDHRSGHVIPVPRPAADDQANEELT